VLEKETVASFRGWYESLGKTLWTVGPPNPAEHRLASSDSPGPLPKPEDEKVLSFLDRIQKTHGDRSIIFVRGPCFLIMIFLIAC
jgi:hypothetical protein